MERLKTAKPILFSTEMVQAILDGRKTVTRRVMKPARKNCRGFRQGDGLWVDGYKPEDKPNGHIKDYSISSIWIRKDCYIRDLAPYKPGDILYVRETWGFLSCKECEKTSMHSNYNPGCDIPINRRDILYGDSGCFVYRTNYGTTEDDSFPPSMFKWRPSIHMPKKAARIFLKVIDIRVERLQDITLEDAKAEGHAGWPYSTKPPADQQIHDDAAIDWFIDLWDSINTKYGYGWETNPWVWVMSFEKIEEQSKIQDVPEKTIKEEIERLRKTKMDAYEKVKECDEKMLELEKKLFNENLVRIARGAK